MLLIHWLFCFHWAFFNKQLEEVYCILKLIFTKNVTFYVFLYICITLIFTYNYNLKIQSPGVINELGHLG